MAVRTTPFVFLFASLTLALAACGGRGSSSPGTDSGVRRDSGPASDMGAGLDLGGTSHDMGITPIDLGTDLGPPRVDAGMCIATCSTNPQCQSTCPMMTGRVECCDTSTSHCYAVTGSVCPAPAVDAGTTDSGSMY